MVERKPPGWYEDPRSSSWLRWWDGDAWTDQYELNRGQPTAEASRAVPQSRSDPSSWSVSAPPSGGGNTWLILGIVAASLILFGLLVAVIATRDDPDATTTPPTMPDFGTQELPPLTTGAGHGAAAGPTTSPSLVVVGDVPIPEGNPGEVSVVLVGRPTIEALPVVVRNMTDQTVVNVAVTVTARGADGELISVGRTQQTTPYTIGPGEWAFTSVYLADQTPPPDTEFETELGYALYEPGFDAPVGVIEEVVHTEGPDRGSFVEISRLIGIVSNTSGQSLANGMGVSILCMSGTAIEGVFGGGSLGGAMDAGTSSPFSSLLYNARCEHFAVGAQPMDLAHQVVAAG